MDSGDDLLSGLKGPVMRSLIERLPERIMDKYTITLVGHLIDKRGGESKCRYSWRWKRAGSRLRENDVQEVS